MNIENLTLKELQDMGIEISEETLGKINTKMNDENSHWEIGKNYLIRTVTMIQLGKLKKVTSKEMVLSDASWVADTGRFSDALLQGVQSLHNSEIEPFKNDVIVNRGAIIDATKYNHALPRDKK